MADPVTALGIAASITQFAVMAMRITRRLRDYHSLASTLPASLRQIQESLPIITKTCEYVQQGSPDEDDTVLNGFVQKFGKQLEDLDALIRELTPADGDSRMVRTSKALRSLRYDTRLNTLRKELEASSTLLCNYVSYKGGQKNASLANTPKQTYLFPNPVTPIISRNSVLNTINNELVNLSQQSPRVVVLNGLGGQGKTSLALDFCSLEHKRYDFVLWIDASSKESLLLSFTAGLRALSSRRYSIYDLETASSYIDQALVQKAWLLIFDNYDTPNMVGPISSLFPKNGTGTVIVTSRNEEVRVLGRAIDVGGMEKEEAVELLLSRTRYRNTKLDKALHQCAEAIAECLGYLPLALDQASAYIGARNLELQTFSKHYLDRRDMMLRQTPTSSSYQLVIGEQEATKTPQSVMTTWEMSFVTLEVSEQDRACIEKFLTIAASISDGMISESLFSNPDPAQLKGRGFPGWLTIFCSAGEWDTYLYQDILAQLARLSLLQDWRSGYSSSQFGFHPMVRQWLLLRIHHTFRFSYVKDASSLLVAGITSHQVQSSRGAGEEMLLYLDALLSTYTFYFGSNSPLGKGELREPAILFSEFYASKARWSKAIKVLESVLKHDQQQLDQRHLNVVLTKCKLAELYIHNSQYREAQDFLTPLEALRGNPFDPTYHGLGQTLIVLALLRTKQDQPESARKLYEDVIEITSTKNLQSTLDMVQTLGSLARVHRYLGNPLDSKRYFSEALKHATNSRSIGALRALVGLADLERSQAEYAEAKKLYEQVLDGFRVTLGTDHPETIGVLINLGITYRNMENWQQAEQHLWDAMVQFERILGEEHIDTIRVKMNLAITYEKEGRVDEASKLYRQVLVVREAKFGLEHSYSLRTVERLAMVLILGYMGDEAEKLARRTLIAGNALTPQQIDMSTQTPEEYLALEQLYLRAIKRESKKLKDQHIDLLEAKESLEEVRRRRIFIKLEDSLYNSQGWSLGKEI